MFFTRIFWKIYLTSLVSVTLCVVALSFSVSGFYEQQIINAASSESVEVPRERIDLVQNQITAISWGVFFSISILATLPCLFVSSRISGPLKELKEAFEALGAGKFRQRLSVSATGELGELASAFNSMNRNLAARIEALEQLTLQTRENAESLSTVLGGMVEGVIAVDSKELILFANKAAFKMIEFDGQQVVGRPYWEVLRNTDVQKVIRDVVSGQFQLRREIIIPRTQSRIAFIASRLPGEPCPGVVLVLYDVTELRKLEKIRSEFVSNVSHELKTPLAAIQACTDTLAGGAIHDKEHAIHFLQQITDQADRLHKLIIDLMELAKIESEDDLFQLEELDIGIPIQEAIDEHLEVAKTRGISLRYEPTIDELLVQADLNGIRTIINNLLDNAIAYTATGGQVSVKWFPEDHNVVIQILDTGMGIETKHLERIFERFYRVDSARSRDAGGTGLGLAIVKHLCQFFSGEITVTSEPNIGSSFVIKIPLHNRV